MMKYLSTFITLIFLSLSTFAQNTPNETQKDNKPPKEKNKKPAMMRNKAGFIKQPYEFRPRIFVGAGLMKSFADVKDEFVPGVHWVGNRYAFDAGLSLNISNSFDISASFMKGKLSGNEGSAGLHRNFETKFTNLQLGLTYNFFGIWKRTTKFFPFLSAGLAVMQYDVYQDLLDRTGNPYYYWSDGLIYDRKEGSAGFPARKPLVQDYKYETRVTPRTQTTFAIPLGGGVGFNFSKKVAIKFGVQYFFSFTDNLDASDKNVTLLASNKDLPQTKKGNDGYLYSYANVSYNFYPFREKPDLRNAPPVYFADFAFMNTEDADGDGVLDIYDKCLGTPKLVAVDGFGCPLDDDGDGIPNYLDKEIKTSKMFVTDLGGKAIDQSKIDRRDTLSIPRSEVTQDLIETPIGTARPANYTVHVGTYGKKMSSRLMVKLNSIEGLVETKINDSLTVYTIGNYGDFNQAQAKQNQLIEAGYDQAFGVNEKKLKQVSTDLNTLATKPTEFTDNRRELLEAAEKEKAKKDDKLQFKVELTEYRLRIGLEKIATIIAKYGVEMHSTTGGLRKYTIGGFETPEEADVLRQEVEKLGLKEAKVAAYFNDSFIEMDDALDILKIKKSKAKF